MEIKTNMKICKDGRIWGQNNKDAKKPYIKKGYNMNSAYPKGHKPTEETKLKISQSRINKYKGSENPNWQGGLTSLVQLIRHCFEYRQWRSDVFTRDDFNCQKCGIKGERLNAHHIVSFTDIVERYEILTLEEAINCAELWNINNGQTLCQDCHIELHKNPNKRRRNGN